ncbi:carbamoyltransferase C-terminal domain-containing protein [Streptomyces mirabilis]|uniref:carbamoyltransferase C-terminal domain-containing protein n=1 Tax=Streptomyces mirabilis TaxID=68239 RepID=UPI0033B58D65
MVQLVAAVLTDRASTWFDLNAPSPFMLSARLVGPDHADKIAGVLHVDGTARVQTGDPATAPAYGVLRALPPVHRPPSRPEHQLYQPRAPRPNTRPYPRHAPGLRPGRGVHRATQACNTERDDDLHPALEGSRPRRRPRRRPARSPPPL